MPKIKGMALLHPSYILRDQSMIPVFIADLKKSLLEPPEHYNIYPSLQDVQNFTATTFAFDIETSRATGEIICVGLSDQVYHAMVVPFRGAYISELKRIFANSKVLIGQNVLQFDINILFPALGLEWRPE